MNEFGSNDSESGSVVEVEPGNLGTILRQAAMYFGNRTAVADIAGRSLTFRDVEERSNRLANVLSGAAGLGERVGILTPNIVESVEIDFAAIKSGLTKVPINPRLTADERTYILRDAGVAVLIADESELEFAMDVSRELELRTPVIVIGSSGARDVYAETLADASPTFPQVSRSRGHISQILYTSGTTGRPKGSMLSEGLRIDATRRMLLDELRSITEDDAMGHVGSMSHGSGSKVLAYYLRGARNVPIAKFDPEQLLSLAADRQVTSTFLVPTMVAMLVEAFDGSNVPQFNTVTYGGASMPASTMQEALETFGSVFVQVYGSCEAPHPITVLSKEDHVNQYRKASAASTGRETTFCSVGILTEDGEDVGTDRVGELCVPSSMAMLGYWGAPDATAGALRDGYYWTGDLASRDESGYIQIVGRSRDVIITGGYNVYPAEVERVIDSHALVSEVAVGGIPDPRWGEIVVAWVVSPQGPIDMDEFRNFCRESLAGYKIPKRVEFVESLPRGSTGKVLTSELKRQVLGERAAGVDI